jgi:hypothetical protein
MLSITMSALSRQTSPGASGEAFCFSSKPDLFIADQGSFRNHTVDRRKVRSSTTHLFGHQQRP